MIESPVLDILMDIVRQREQVKVQTATLRSAIGANLVARFGSVQADVSAVSDLARLESLLRIAATCPDVASFQAAIRSDS